MTGWRQLTADWRPTAALTTAVGFSALLLLLAVALHRRDLLVLAAPLVATVVVNGLRTPVGRLSVRIAVDATLLLEDEATTATIHVDADRRLDAVTTTMASGPSLSVADGPRVRCTAVESDGTVDVAHVVQGARWGRTSAGPATVVASAAQGLLRSRSGARSVPLKVLPLREVFNAVDAVPRAAGIVGPHRSRRPGDGGELSGVRPFTTGDRLKRINWRVSLRTSELHVNATLSDRDTAIMLVLDSSVDVTSEESGNSSLDVSVRAAASIAEHYLHAGDRVGLLDHARPMRAIRPAAGRAHLNRIIDGLLDVSPQPGRDTSVRRVLSTFAPQTLVMLLSPLIGAAVPERAVAISRSGHTVLVVDTLPRGRLDTKPREWTELALRLQLMQRETAVDRLSEHGIPVVPWLGAGSLNHVLQNLNRSAAAPRMR